MKRKQAIDDGHGFARALRLERDRVPSFDAFPFSIPAIRGLEEMRLDRKITFFVGENGSGKSTLLEALAELAGFNREGGSKNFNFETRSEECELARNMRLVRGSRRERGGFFLRAESFFNTATYIDDIGSSAGPSLHEMSHGESFLALMQDRFFANGLYLLDEPEAALSPSRQLTVLRLINGLIENGKSQFVIATHSPILLAYPSFHFLSMSLLLASASLAGGCKGSLALRPATPTFAARAHVGSATPTSPADRYAAPPAVAAPQGPSAEPELTPTTYAPTPRQGPVPSEDPATAPFISLGEPLRGIVTGGVPLYYRVSLKRGQTATLSGLMSRTTDEMAHVAIRLLDPDGVRVLIDNDYVSEPIGEFDRMSDQGTSPVTGEHILKVTTDGGRMDYKILLESPDA